MLDKMLVSSLLLMIPLALGALGCAAPDDTDDTDEDAVAEASQAVTTCVDFAPTDDTSTRSDQPNTTFGSKATMVVGTSAPAGVQRNVVLQFDVSAIPSAATVTYAKLDLTITQLSGTGIVYHGPFTTAPVWSEATLTHNILVTQFQAPITGQFPTALGHNLTDVQAEISYWRSGTYPNRGMTMMSPGSNATIASKEHADASARPKLTVCYN